MRDYTKNTARWISGLTKDEFDEFIRVFLKEFWNVDLVTITDGPNDGGIDVKIFRNNLNREVPMQITIQKEVLKKLKDDIKKISELIKKYDYSDNFYFYYSHGISESKCIELTDYARTKFSVSLKLFDNKLISSYIDKPDFYLSRTKINDLLGDFSKPQSEYFDESDKLYFEYITYSPDSFELKEKFIYAFVLNELSHSNSTGISKKGLIFNIEKHFNTRFSENYCNKVIQKLLSDNKVELFDSKNNILKLSKKEYLNIKSIQESAIVLQSEFIKGVNDIIQRNNSSVKLEKLLDLIYSIFQSHMQIIIDEVNLEYDFEESDVDLFKKLYHFIEKSVDDKSIANSIINDLFELCKENDFLNRLCAGKLFKNLLDQTDYIKHYNRLEKEVFIDTPILLSLFLVMLDRDFEYNNYRFKIAKDLFGVIFGNKVKAKFYTTDLYIRELADYLERAINLIPLQKLNIFETLGGSSNEILKYYLKLKEEGKFNKNYEDFIENKIGILLKSYERKTNKTIYLESFLTKLFKDNKVNIDAVKSYDKIPATRIKYARTAKLLSGVYKTREIVRKTRSLKYDSLFFMHLDNPDYNFIEPTVLTWDSTFKEFRKIYNDENPNARFWHLYPPGRYLDYLSLMQFKINNSTISNEILSIIETEFEVVKGVRKISDVLVNIVDLKSAQGTKLTTGLADIRSLSIYESEKITDGVKPDKFEFEPVEKLVTDITDYYFNGFSKFTFEQFKQAIEKFEFVDVLLDVIKTESYKFIEYKSFSDNYLSELDKKMKKILED